MYREKLISQIEKFENMQERCAMTDIPELVELSDNILKLAQKVDELDKQEVHIDVLSKTISNTFYDILKREKKAVM